MYRGSDSTPYQIVGIYETGQAVEEGGGVVTLEEVGAAQKPRQVNAYQLKVRRPEQVDAVIKRLTTFFPGTWPSPRGARGMLQPRSGLS